MKRFAKILFFILTVLGINEATAQPCTPDNNFPGTQGTLPESLEGAWVNQPYSAIIQFKAPLDTSAIFNGTPITIRVDSLRITGVLGLPSGFSYECHNASCMVNGGQVGCAKITGTPTSIQVGSYPLKVVVKLRGKITSFIIPIQIPESLQYDTNYRYTIVIGQNMGLHRLQSAPPLLIYPNPSSTHLNIELGSAIAEDGEIKLRDLQGREVLSQKLTNRVTTIETAAFKKGLYILQVNARQGIYQSRVYIE